MGEAAIGWQDIVAWQGITGIELDAWEARTIRNLSQIFVSQRYASEKLGCPAPYNGDRSEIASRRDVVGQQVAALFKGLAKQPAPQPGPPPPAGRPRPRKE